MTRYQNVQVQKVSTHSRLKAAGSNRAGAIHHPPRFNTQPPEGGWVRRPERGCTPYGGFNTQPPEGGWNQIDKNTLGRIRFQHTAA